jgi:hypothetical protein
MTGPEVRPRQIKALNRKGYQRADLADAWSRYLPEVSAVSAVSDAQGNRGAADVDLEAPPMVSDGFGWRGEPIPSRGPETGLSLPSGGSETTETSETGTACPLHPEPSPATCWTCENGAA